MYRVGNQIFNTIQEARAFDFANSGTIDNVRSAALNLVDTGSSNTTGDSQEPETSFLGQLGAFLGGSGGRSIAGLGLLTGAYNQLGNIGERGLRLGQDLATRQMEQAAFRPYTVTTATGGQFTAGPEGSTLSLSPEEQALQQGLLGRAGRMFGPTTGAAELQQAGLGAVGRGEQLLASPTFGINQTRAGSERTFGLGSQFMDEASMSTAEREQAVFDRIRAAQAPEEQRQRLALEERLAAQGRLGTSSAAYGGATPEQLALATAQTEARDRAMLAAMQQAQAEQAQQAGLGAQFAGLGTNLAQQRQALNTARQAQALQALQAGQGLLGGGIGLQGARQQLGLSALSGAYLPQAQLLNALAPGQTAAAAQQQAQLYGTGLFGEATASGIDALLGASLGQANLIGTAGAGLLSGAQSGVDAETQARQNLLGGLFDTVGSGISRIFGLGDD